MDETVLVGLIAGVFGAIAAGVPSYFAQRNAPSKKVSDTASIVDSTGKVITMYRSEIDRLDNELIDCRFQLKAMIDEMAKRPTRQELMQTVTELKAFISVLENQVKERPTREELLRTITTLRAEVAEFQLRLRELGGTES